MIRHGQEEGPITVGVLKQMFERCHLPDDAILHYNDPEFGWSSVGPEGEEIMFITREQLNTIDKQAKRKRLAHPVWFRRWATAIRAAMEDFKKETNQ